MAPDYSRERVLRTTHARVCGVDEAGRGPLAGPVVACAVVLDPARIPKGLDDSKRLSPRARERLLNELRECSEIGLGIAEPDEICRANILWASLAAMTRAVGALEGQPYALVDGNRMPPGVTGEAVVRGDATCLSIAAASVVAKVVRDQLMAGACARFPGYGLSGHKGYPTAAHRKAVARLGRSPIHREGFGRF